MKGLKRIMPLIVLIICAASISGCSKDNSTVYEKIQSKLLSMETYEANATVTYISNKTNHSYETKQQCRITGEYRIEVTGPENVAGNITISDGTIICQYNSRVAGKVSIATTEAMERSELFLTSFIKNYVKSQDVSVSVSSIDNTEYTVLEATIPGEHPYLRTEKLWIDNNTLKPSKLVIYDPSGTERIIVTYNSFEYNVTLGDELFTVE